MARPLPPTRREIEALEHDLYKRGDITSVARLKGIDPSYVSKQLNPDEEDHKGAFYPYILHLWYVDHSTDGLGDGYQDLTARLRNGWRGNGQPEKQHVVRLAKAVNGNMWALVEAQAADLPEGELMVFIDKTMRELDDFKLDWLNRSQLHDEDNKGHKHLRKAK